MSSITYIKYALKYFQFLIIDCNILIICTQLHNGVIFITIQIQFYIYRNRYWCKHKSYIYIYRVYSPKYSAMLHIIRVMDDG